MNSLRGQFLVATQDLEDPNFRRSVVLIVQHNDEGALGLIVNRPTSAFVHEIWEKVSEEPCDRQARLYIGGPCQGPLMVLHDQPHIGGDSIDADLIFCADSESLAPLMATDDGLAKFCIGFSGWSPGQLEGEIEGGSWHTIAAESELVFALGIDLWKELMQRVLTTLLTNALRLKYVPADPTLN